MSTFETLEEGVETSRPIELYVVQIGSEDPVRWTSGNKSITAPVTAGNSYSPERGLSRTSIALGEEERSRTLTITVNPTNKILRRYVNVPPSREATVGIFRTQEDDPVLEMKRIYSGVVMSGSWERNGKVGLLSCQTIEAASSRTIPRYTHGSQCQHMVYGPECGVDPVPFTFSGTVSLVSGNDITIPNAGAFPHGFLNGYVSPTGSLDFRQVVAQSGDVLTLRFPFEINPEGAAVEAVAGCDRLVAGDCANTFDNIARASGKFFVPDRNVFARGLFRA